MQDRKESGKKRRRRLSSPGISGSASSEDQGSTALGTFSISSPGSGSISTPQKPKRPLSAYNLFFRSERAKYVEIARRKELEAASAEGFDGSRKGAVFEYLARHVASKWNELPDEEREKYEARSAEEKRRYDREMMQWRLRQMEHKMTSTMPTSAMAGAGSSIAASASPTVGELGDPPSSGCLARGGGPTPGFATALMEERLQGILLPPSQSVAPSASQPAPSIDRSACQNFHQPAPTNRPLSDVWLGQPEKVTAGNASASPVEDIMSFSMQPFHSVNQQSAQDKNLAASMDDANNKAFGISKPSASSSDVSALSPCFNPSQHTPPSHLPLIFDQAGGMPIPPRSAPAAPSTSPFRGDEANNGYRSRGESGAIGADLTLTSAMCAPTPLRASMATQRGNTAMGGQRGGEGDGVGGDIDTNKSGNNDPFWDDPTVQSLVDTMLRDGMESGDDKEDC